MQWFLRTKASCSFQSEVILAGQREWRFSPISLDSYASLNAGMRDVSEHATRLIASTKMKLPSCTIFHILSFDRMIMTAPHVLDSL